MARQEAPVIRELMDSWVSLGGGDSGILGDSNHTYGGHLPANELPDSDYTRRLDPNGSDGPYIDWDYAVAGDFSHKNKENLRRLHRITLLELMDGKHPMLCEFIGKPWEDRPVYYWARWNGIKTLQLYTGSGHDHWSHIMWYRSRVDEKPNLWGNTLEARLNDEGWAVQFYQRALSQLGYTDNKGNKLKFDGVYGTATKEAVNKFRAVYSLEPYDAVSPWMATQIIEDLANQKAVARVKPVADNLTNALGTVATFKEEYDARLTALTERLLVLESQPLPVAQLTLPVKLTGTIEGVISEQ